MSQITIVTLAIGHDFRKGMEPCLEAKRDYALKHGYSYIEGHEEHWDRSRPIAWSKVPLILGLLSKAPEGAIFWLSDADVLITNPALRLEEHILPHFPAGKDMLFCIDACGHLNSGNFFMRNSPWLRDYWERVGQQTDLIYHIWWENAAMLLEWRDHPEDLTWFEIYEADPTRFNAYLSGLPNKKMWEPGCFLVHFAGVYDLKKMEELQREILAGGCPRIPF
jgi:hypothetical protein